MSKHYDLPLQNMNSRLRKTFHQSSTSAKKESGLYDDHSKFEEQLEMIDEEIPQA